MRDHEVMLHVGFCYKDVLLAANSDVSLQQGAEEDNDRAINLFLSFDVLGTPEVYIRFMFSRVVFQPTLQDKGRLRKGSD